MESTLLLLIIAVLVIRWFSLREKLKQIDYRFEELHAAIRRLEWREKQRQAEAPQPAPEPAPVPEPVPAPAPGPPVVTPEREALVGPPLEPPFEPQPEPHPTREPAPEPVREPRPPRTDWESLIGGNWSLKLGVLAIVIGLAWALQYTWTQVGPFGRIAISYGAALLMLGSGIWSETRERYRTFGYGLIGGGWAALYLTTYAMYGIPQAKIIENPFAATVLLLLVALGMIAHSLKYRSQTVTGVAAFIAFVTLAISDVTTFSVVALIPLVTALLYIAYRNEWARFAVFGVIATYATCAMHKDAGAPIWQTQLLFLAYWLLFEIFDLLRANRLLLPLNALGFLALSSAKWLNQAPNDIWQLYAGASAMYLVSTLLRARSDRWRPAVTLQAALATAAILLKLHDQNVPLALVILAELYCLAGIRFRSRWLRWMAAALFALEIGHLLIGEVGRIAPHTWEPVAIATIAIFYLNRALRATDVAYGYVAIALVALVTGFEATAANCGPTWMLLALVPFAFGWGRRQLDFRIQGYGLAVTGAIATATYALYPAPALVIGAAVAYAFVQSALRSNPDRFLDEERRVLPIAASIAASLALGALVWKLVPGDYLGIGWLALALIVFEAGLLDQPREFRWQAWLIAIFGMARVFDYDLSFRRALISAALAYLLAFRARGEQQGRISAAVSIPGTWFLLAGLSVALPDRAVSPAWIVVALLLAELRVGGLGIQALVVAAVVFARCVWFDFPAQQAMLSVVPVIAGYAVALLRRERGSYQRLCYALMAAGLTAALIYNQVSGSMLTIAWGLEGVALLGAGFPLRERVLRLTGLAMLTGCILKLFAWDLRNLDTLPRILSFIVLGALLVGVSWIYTRFRESLQRYL